MRVASESDILQAAPHRLTTGKGRTTRKQT